jgi:hypothetical protein
VKIIVKNFSLFVLFSSFAFLTFAENANAQNREKQNGRYQPADECVEQDTRSWLETTQDLLTVNVPGFPAREFGNGGTIRLNCQPQIPPTLEELEHQNNQENPSIYRDEIQGHLG